MFDRVLVQRIKPQTVVGGIALPDSVLQDSKSANEARVVAVGKGFRTSDGKFTPPVVSVGDRVVLPEFTTEVTFDGEQYVFIREEDLVAKIEEAAGRVPDLKDLPRE